MLRPNIATPLYMQLYKELIRDINNGNLVPGTVLPSERVMATLQDVSRVTVRNAYIMLEEQGYAVSVHGKGTYIM